MDLPPGPDDRLTAFGTQLIETHMWLREELAQLREDLAADEPPDPQDPRGLRDPRKTRELRAHCLTFCSALSRHHTDEDDGTFPVLADRYPELRPVLEQLTHDHEVVSGILRSVEELLDGFEPGGARRVAAELDGLAALLESHFVYEEKRIVTALNAISAGSAPSRDG
ncbi:hemerythrin domain-containing protein [Streptomyces sp. NPDC058280]|uniref:hemerythrin domain-containing protein n=1 Tax=Streptomyces sp. NPDC058280 TaxID=3346419 RepID=UPI0036E6AA1E